MRRVRSVERSGVRSCVATPGPGARTGQVVHAAGTQNGGRVLRCHIAPRSLRRPGLAFGTARSCRDRLKYVTFPPEPRPRRARSPTVVGVARPLRICFPGAVYHLMSRGNARQPIVLDDEDRGVFLRSLAQAISRYGWLCHAYCLMDNHYHLALETPNPNLPLGMRHLNGVYAQRFNERYARSGHVFAARYRPILVENETHFLRAGDHVRSRRVRVEQLPSDSRPGRAGGLALHGLGARAVRRYASSCPGAVSRIRCRRSGRGATRARRASRDAAIPRGPLRLRGAARGDPARSRRAGGSDARGNLSPVPGRTGSHRVPAPRLSVARDRRVPRLPLLDGEQTASP